MTKEVIQPSLSLYPGGGVVIKEEKICFAE
jgi:hypothetical protein